MTAKSKSTTLGVKTVARLNTAINAEDAEAGDVHYQTSCYIKHNYYRITNAKKISDRGAPLQCSPSSVIRPRLWPCRNMQCLSPRRR